MGRLFPTGVPAKGKDLVGGEKELKKACQLLEIGQSIVATREHIVDTCLMVRNRKDIVYPFSRVKDGADFRGLSGECSWARFNEVLAVMRLKKSCKRKSGGHGQPSYLGGREPILKRLHQVSFMKDPQYLLLGVDARIDVFPGQSWGDVNLLRQEGDPSTHTSGFLERVRIFGKDPRLGIPGTQRIFVEDATAGARREGRKHRTALDFPLDLAETEAGERKCSLCWPLASDDFPLRELHRGKSGWTPAARMILSRASFLSPALAPLAGRGVVPPT